jgi:Glycosyl hydrolase family 76
MWPVTNITLTLLAAAIQVPIVVAKASVYQTNAVTAANVLQQFYNTTNGLWQVGPTALWWNSANCMTALADLTAYDPDVSIVTGAIWPNTFMQAQKYNLNQLKAVPGASASGTNAYNGPQNETILPGGFLNGFYDDEGWWALGWIAAYDITQDSQYLQVAANIFNDMVSTGYNATCGGIWWDKVHQHNVAIANELFLSVAAHLANRVTNKAYYVSWAEKQWAWFQQSGLINAQNNINDGLNLQTCKNNNGTVWSYNQGKQLKNRLFRVARTTISNNNLGVILGGLVELNKASPNDSYISTAKSIASAAISKLQDSAGVLHDPFEPNLGHDGDQFKGIFMRNLQVLQQATGDASYKAFLEKNADSIWSSARDTSTNLIGPVWTGPPAAGGGANMATQSSGLDALVGAAVVQ